MRTTQLSARWTGEKLNFIGVDGKGNEVKMGGDDVSPGQMLLLALLGCTGMDVLSILEKMRQNVTDVQVEVTAEQNEDYPRPYQNLKINFIISGSDIDPKQVERAIELSTHKYCVVGQTIEQETAVTTSYQIQS